jgi:hypothetical protein
MKKINNIHTLSYFKKRLKDSGYVVYDIMNSFSLEDPRKWTILVNPSLESVFVTCVVNRNGLGDLPEFEINDGGMRFQRNLIIKTKSMEVIMNMLNSKGILPDDSFYKKTQ